MSEPSKKKNCLENDAKKNYDSEYIDKFLEELRERAARLPLITPVGWIKKYIMCYSEHRKAIFTVLIIASTQNNIPMHLEAHFYKLPKEILFYIFQLLCESDGDRNYYII